MTLEYFEGEPYFWSEVFKARGMRQLAEFNGQHRDRLVTELIANVHLLFDVPGDCKIESTVWGGAAVIRPATFVEFFGLPQVDQQDLWWPNVGAVEHEVMTAGIYNPDFQWISSQSEKKFLLPRFAPLFVFTLASIYPLGRRAEVSR